MILNYYAMNKDQKGEQVMKKLRRMKIVSLTILIILLLTACQSKAERNELTNHIGKSVSTFERRAGVKLTEQSNGVYAKEGVVQVLAPKKKITSVTIMSNGTKFTVSGLRIGMAKEEADKLLKAAYGKEISMTENKDGNADTYSYTKDNRELYVTYDAAKKTISELSYYKVEKTKQKAEATGEPKDLGELMVMVGDTKVYYNEAMAHLILAKDNYETNYGKNIWNADIFNNGEAFGKVIKEEVINQITELKIIRAKAMEFNISLTEEEKAQAASYAKAQYQKLTEEDRQRYQITEEVLTSVYEDNLLANKVFESKTIDVDTNVSDDEAKQITVQDIFIQNYNLDSKGKKVDLSAQDKLDAYKRVKSLLKQAKETEDFKTLAEANSEADTIEYTFGHNDVPKKYGDAFENAAFSLKTGQLSSIITTETGWHILYCVSDFNKDATTQVKEDIIDGRRIDLFAKLYKEWSANYSVVVNNEAWDAIPLED